MKPTITTLDTRDSDSTDAGTTHPGMLARAATGAIAGAVIGIFADPFTAVVGAVACAVLGATSGFSAKE